MAMDWEILVTVLVCVTIFAIWYRIDERKLVDKEQTKDRHESADLNLFIWRRDNPDLRVCNHEYPRTLVLECIKQYDHAVAIGLNVPGLWYREIYISLLYPPNSPPPRRRYRLPKRPAKTRAVSFIIV